MVGQCDIVGPDIELPLDQAQYAAMHPPSMDAHTHVHVHGHYLTHQTAKREGEENRERELRECHITKATQYKATTCIVQLCVGCAAFCLSVFV